MFKYPLQDRLFEALSKHDKSLGEHEKPLSDMYRGGLHVFGDSANPDRIAQSAHSFRELMEKAPEYINVPQEVKEQRTGYSLKQEAVDIKSAWAKVQERSDRCNSNSSWSGEIDAPLANFLEHLCRFFEEFGENRPTRRQDFAEFRQRMDPSTEALPKIIDHSINLDRKWVELHKKFTRISHHRSFPDSLEFKGYIDQLEQILIAVLVPQTVSDHEAIKQEITILEKTTIKHGDVKCLLRNHIKRTADRVYFYENISSPDWIDPLSQEGVFNELPEPVEEGDFVKYPRWPEGQYLLRIARSTTDQATQELIAKIVARISDSENQHAESVRVQVAIALPPHMACQFVNKQRERLRGERYIGLVWARAIVNVALHVAKAEYVKPALYLLKSLLRVLPDSRPKEEMPLGIPKTGTVIDSWEYAHLIEEDLPAFVEACGPFEVLKIVLCPLLDQAVKLNMVDSDEQSDFSIVWRPDIQESEIYDSSPHQLLTTAVINTAVQAVGNSPQCIRKLVLLLEEYASRRPIFARIVLHLLSQDLGESQDLITDKLTSQHSINNVHLWAEYANLLKQQFPNLLPEQQDKIIQSILAGPQLEGATPQRQGTMDDNDEWILTRLHLISDHLSCDASKQYRSLLSNYPNPESLLSSLPPIRIKSWIGPTSPLSGDEMAERSPLEIVEFLREWSPTGNWDAPTPEDLSRILAITVEKNAADYADEAHAFSDLEPTYIKALFYGLTETGQKIPWEPVLQLSRGVVDQPRDYNYVDQHVTDGRAFGRDPDWGWTRKSIAHLLRKGLKDGPTQIPYDYQEDVWYICEKLLRDPDPTLESEQQYGWDNFGFTNWAINTVRGTTMHVVMAFIKWSSVNLHEGVDPNNGRGVLDVLPRVRQVLDAHLSIECDPSLSVRAVYGEWFPHLYQIDKKWTSSIIPILFPLERDKEEYFLAAWHSYCLMARADLDLFKLLSDQYEYAIKLLNHERRDRMRSEYKMAEQLAMLFALEEEVSLVKVTIDKFFFFADDHLRSYMVTRMAVGSPDYERKPFTPYVDRLKRFWDQRLAMLEGGESPSDSQRELEAYGKWFLLNYLSPDWVLEQLLRTLKLAKNVRDWPGVCGKLADLSQDYPQETIECIRCLAEGGNERFLARTDNCKIVLSRVMDSGNEGAKESAKEVVNHLVARGFPDYRSVIDSSE